MRPLHFEKPDLLTTRDMLCRIKNTNRVLSIRKVILEIKRFMVDSVEETYREEKTSPAGRFRRGEHLPEGEIIAIIITIVTGIIEIIINIIPNISTISTTIPSHLTIATCVVICTIYPLYSISVDYYFVVNAIEFFWRNIMCPDCFPPIYHL